MTTKTTDSNCFARMRTEISMCQMHKSTSIAFLGEFKSAVRCWFLFVLSMLTWISVGLIVFFIARKWRFEHYFAVRTQNNSKRREMRSRFFFRSWISTHLNQKHHLWCNVRLRMNWCVEFMMLFRSRSNDAMTTLRLIVAALTSTPKWHFSKVSKDACTMCTVCMFRWISVNFCTALDPSKSNKISSSC